MSHRRTTILITLASVILALVAGGFYLRQRWQQFMETHDVQALEWEGFAVSFNGLAVQRLEILQVQHERQLALKAGGISLDWQWTGLELTSLTLDKLHVDWQIQSDSISETGPSAPFEVPEQFWRWLPYELAIRSFHVTAPCAAGGCDLDGALTVTRGPELLPVQARLELEHEGHVVQLAGELTGGSLEAPDLKATLAIDGQSHIALQSGYRTVTENQQAGWNGSMSMPELPQADWLLAWLQLWHPMPVSDLPAQPDNASMKASWELVGPPGADFLQNLAGDVAVSAELPQPWPIPGIATVSGRIEVALTGTGGHWKAKSADADVKLREPGDWVLQLPELLRPGALDIRIRPADSLPDLRESERFLPLNLAISSHGQTHVEINSHLAVATTKPWAVQLGETTIDASVPELDLGEWTLRGLAAGISVSGHVKEREMALALGPRSSVDILAITNTDPGILLQFDRVQADLSQLTATAGYRLEGRTLEGLTVKGPVSLTSVEVHHSLVYPQSWRFNGVLDSGNRHLDLDGRLTSDSGAYAKLDLAYPFEGDFALSSKLVMDGEAAARALAKTLVIWPESLQITSGQVDANANFRLPVTGASEFDADLAMNSVSGIFNRTAWSGLNGDLNIDLRGPELIIKVPELTVAQVNPGVPVGPMGFGGSYHGLTNEVSSGKFKLDQFTARFLGGSLEISEGTWNLADLPLRVPVKLNKVELSELMRVYPSEGLAGTGTLSGKLPLLIDREGIRVDQGRVLAIKPGGTLKLPADRLRGIAQGNQAMELVASAMENFHYSVLTSTIDYDQDGRLFLGLHLEGSNPDVQGGHPIVLNINLEEDIPALLTSLQLSGRVNEAVTERVRELVQERQTAQDDVKVEN